MVTNMEAGKLPFAVLAGLPIDIHKRYLTHMTTIDSCKCTITSLYFANKSALCLQESF